mgnify:FL=1
MTSTLTLYAADESNRYFDHVIYSGDFYHGELTDTPQDAITPTTLRVIATLGGAGNRDVAFELCDGHRIIDTGILHGDTIKRDTPAKILPF